MRIFIVLLFCFVIAPAAGRGQARYRVRPEKFNVKPQVPEQPENDEREHIDPKSRFNLNDRGNEIDEFFYLKWNKGRKLNFDDFRYDKSYFAQQIPEKDADLLKAIYPNYQAFYNMLERRATSDSAATGTMQPDSMKLRLNKRLDSLYTGHLYSVSVDKNLSFERNLDSPAASVLTISPAIYAVNDTMVYYNIVAIFSKYESWIVIKSRDILAHEQIHFDIFELYARKLRKHWVEQLHKHYSEGGIYDVTRALYPVYEEVYNELYRVQAEFDEQTAQLTTAGEPIGGLNVMWDRNIHAQLDSLKMYENPEGTVILRQ